MRITHAPLGSTVCGIGQKTVEVAMPPNTALAQNLLKRFACFHERMFFCEARMAECTSSPVLPHGEDAVILCFVLPAGGFRKYSGKSTCVFEAGFYLREGILQRSGTVFSQRSGIRESPSFTGFLRNPPCVSVISLSLLL